MVREKKRGSPCFLWAAIIEKQHRIFDRHEAIICPLLYAAVSSISETLWWVSVTDLR